MGRVEEEPLIPFAKILASLHRDLTLKTLFSDFSRNHPMKFEPFLLRTKKKFIGLKTKTFFIVFPFSSPNSYHRSTRDNRL
jgi:hypothetical protein